ncbi:MAG: tetratricopeptide repeat protein, partial [Clostridia bacterium]|nr:tetratricopeptide repeat protein [Clostridia bacterium]
GAGVWNRCKLIPLQYFQGICLEKLGKTSDAKALFEEIADTAAETFTLSYLRELPSFKAMSLKHLGRNSEATALISKYLRIWEEGLEEKNDGFYGTTAFFFSFIKDSDKTRRANFLWLIGLAEYALGEKEKADRYIQESLDNYDNNYSALYYKKYYMQ